MLASALGFASKTRAKLGVEMDRVQIRFGIGSKPIILDGVGQFHQLIDTAGLYEIRISAQIIGLVDVLGLIGGTEHDYRKSF